jgi:hypothetical protein
MKPVEAKTKKTLGQISAQEVENDIPGDVAPVSLDGNQIASARQNPTLEENPKVIATRVEADTKEDGSVSHLKRARSDKTYMDSDGAQGDQAEVAICAVRDLNPELKTLWMFVGKFLHGTRFGHSVTWRGKN